MLQNYSQETLDLLQKAIQGDSKAFKTLMTTQKCPELAAFVNALNGDKQAEMWLKARVSRDYWLVVNAIKGDENAFKALQTNDDKFNVSFVLACRGETVGKYWLAQNGYSSLFPICEAIAELAKKRFWQGVLYKANVKLYD